MADESRLINFEGTEDADPDMTTDTRQAVASLDFETAERIVENQRLSTCQKLRTSSQQFLRESEQEQQEIKRQQERRSQILQEKTEIAVQDVKLDYQTRFTLLVERHRSEAEDLKNRWIRLHTHAEGVARKKIDDLIHTSKVLASLQSFESAKDLRDRTMQQEQDIIDNEVRAGDEHFRKHFEIMIQRHQQQYEALFQEMNREIELAKGGAMVEDTKNRTESQFEENLSPVRMIKKISGSDFSHLEKKSMIGVLSPGKLRNVRTAAPAKMSETLLG